MPTDFVACALFAALHGKNTQYLRGEYIACINGYTVTYTGKRLTQVHADIVMGALHLMRGRQWPSAGRYCRIPRPSLPCA